MRQEERNHLVNHFKNGSRKVTHVFTGQWENPILVTAVGTCESISIIGPPYSAIKL
jgi:hypothetical protein